MNDILRQSSALYNASGKRAAGLKALFALLCLLFFAAQVQGLSHTHDGNLDFQVDCEVCLKLSSDDDVLISFSAEIHYQRCYRSAPQYANVDLAVRPLRFYHPRAPPSA